MIKTYKIISGLEYVNSSKFFAKSIMDNLCGHRIMDKEHFQKVICKNFFSQRMIDQWNGLTEEVVKAKTLNSFKKCIKSILLT